MSHPSHARKLARDFAPRRRQPPARPKQASPLGEFLGALEDRLTPAFGPTGLLSPDAAGATAVAEVAAAPRLASLDTGESALLNGLLTGLTGAGSNVSLSALDYNGLSAADVNLGGLLGGLQAELGLASAADALTANVTLGQVLTAAAGAARADGNAAVAASLDAVRTALGGATGTVQLDDLFDVDLATGAYDQAGVNALDLLTGAVQLFNYQNVLVTPSPVTVSGAALGLGSVLNSVALEARVVEPPVFAIGPAGTQFSSAAVRLRLNVDLVDLSLDSTALVAALSPLGTVTASVNVGQVQLLADVARGSGTIQAIDAITSAVTVRSTPSVANVYLGTASDAVFFSPTRAFNPAADLTPGTVADLGLRVTVPILGTVLADVSAGLTVRAAALGSAATPVSTTFNAPFPQATTVGSSAGVVANLVSTLVGNLELGLTGSLGALLDPLVNGTILPALRPVVAGGLAPVLGDVLTGVADPALNALGVGIGEMDVAVLGADLPNPGPVAAADAAATFVGRAVTVAVTANDTLSSGTGPGTVAVATPPAHGTAVANADGTVTYTPAAGFVGTDSFAYTLADAFGRSAGATVSISVNLPPNTAPVAVADPGVAVPYGTATAVPVLANDTDPDGDPLSVAAVTPPAHGTAVVNADGTVTYTPAPGYAGPDSFTYAVSDGRGGTATATVTVVVGPPPNQPPVVAPDTASIASGTAFVIDVLSNDSDPDGNPLTVTAVTPPAHGTAVVNATGTVTYTPAAGFVGTDAFTYAAADGSGGSSSAVVTVTVMAPPNGAPVAVADPGVAVPHGTTTAVPVLTNDSDPDGDPLSVVAVSPPAHGTVTIGPAGTVLYTPAAGYAGPDAFTYTAADGRGGTAVGSVTVVVAPRPNGAPTVTPDATTVPPGTAVTVDVLANDSDPDGDPLTITAVSPPAHGSVVVNADGTITYTPAAGFVGSDSFTYTVTDGLGGTGSATLAVSVSRAVGVPPTDSPAGPAGNAFVSVGADTFGGPRVTVYSPDGTVRANFFAYDPNGRFGVTVATADLTGDGVPDFVTGPGTGGGPHVKVFDGATLAEVASFFAFEPEFRGGVFLAAGDVDGDGTPDIVVGAGIGGGPRVRVFDGRDRSALTDVMAFDAGSRGGVRVASADLNADGREDLIVTDGAGTASQARMIDAATGQTMRTYSPFEAGFTGGIYVAAGDLNADGVPDMVVGAGAGARVRVYDGATDRVLDDRLVYEPRFTGGVRVAVTDLDRDGRAEVVAGPGPGGGPRVVGYEVGEAATMNGYVFEDTFLGGITVG